MEYDSSKSIPLISKEIYNNSGPIHQYERFPNHPEENQEVLTLLPNLNGGSVSLLQNVPGDSVNQFVKQSNSNIVQNVSGEYIYEYPSFPPQIEYRQHLIDNTNQVMHTTVRYNENTISDPQFQKRIRDAYSAECLSQIERPSKRGRPSRTYNTQKLHSPSLASSYMQLLDVPAGMESNALTLATQNTGIDNAGQRIDWITGYTTYNVPDQDKLVPVPGWSRSKNILPTHNGLPVIPPGCTVCDIKVVKTKDGYQLSVPDGIELTEENVRNIITAASTGDVIFKSNHNFVNTERDNLVLDQSHSTSSFNSDVTAGGSSACTGSSHQINGSSQENLAAEPSQTKINSSVEDQKLQSTKSDCSSSPVESNKDVNLDMGEEVVLQTVQEDGGPVPSVASVSVVSTSDESSNGSLSSTS